MPKEFINFSGLQWYVDELEELFVKPEINQMNLNNIFRLPLRNKEIYFNDDIWDFFDPVTIIVGKHNDYNFNFSEVVNPFKTYAKQYILELILIKRLRFSTIKQRYKCLMKFMNFLNDKLVDDYKLFSHSLFKQYIEEVCKDISEILKSVQIKVVVAFLKKIEFYDGRVNFKYIYKYLLSTINQQQIQAEIENRKTTLIPEDILNCIIKVALDSILDENQDKITKKAACMIILLSQTGMRVGELRLLEANQIEEVNIFNGNEKISYLKFITYKTITGESYAWTKTFLTQHAVLAYNTLVEMTKEDRKKENSAYLLGVYGKTGRYKGRPLESQCIRRALFNFVLKNKDKIPCLNLSLDEDDNFKSLSVYDIKKFRYSPQALIKGLKDTDIVYCPLPHQYRVTVCTKLYEQNVDLDWIREHMNHLSLYMTQHYIREQNKYENQMKEAQKGIRKLIEEEKTILSSDKEVEKALHRKINLFIKKNNLNVSVDVAEIIEGLKGNSPIREKEQGYCIKSNYGRQCPKNLELDIPEISPSHIASFEFLDITYNRYIKIKETIMYNQNNGFNVEAEREKKRLVRLVENYLLPELEDLHKEVSQRGAEHVIKENPELYNIVNSFVVIKEEVLKWIKSN
ncbi:tyrosine-type recombinase/integrase [Bacillus sp. 1A]|uniref:tyrosine-type recombinase/integrase n=1 Tax=Bacillus sp. 1A TaxID=3461399 RepID=UPI004044B27F